MFKKKSLFLFLRRYRETVYRYNSNRSRMKHILPFEGFVYRKRININLIIMALFFFARSVRWRNVQIIFKRRVDYGNYALKALQEKINIEKTLSAQQKF